MNSEQWAQRVERWDRWYLRTLTDLKVKAEAGDSKAREVLDLWLHYCGQMKGRPAMTRAVRETGWRTENGRTR